MVTDRLTDTQNYLNPRCACAPRVNGNVEHYCRAGATQLGICPRCWGSITCRQRTAFQHRSTCRRYMRIVRHWQNGEQVSRTVLTLRFQLVSRGPPGNWHAAVCARAILAYYTICKLHLGTMKIGKRYSLGQSPKVTAHAVEWRGEFSSWLDRSARHRVWEIVRSAYKAAHAHLHDVRR